jgi:hypothetical protein
MTSHHTMSAIQYKYASYEYGTIIQIWRIIQVRVIDIPDNFHTSMQSTPLLCLAAYIPSLSGSAIKSTFRSILDIVLKVRLYASNE